MVQRCVSDLYSHSRQYYLGGSKPSHLTGVSCVSFSFPSCPCRVPRDLCSSGPGLPPALSPSFPLRSGCVNSESPFGLEWGLMAGMRGFASHGGSFLSRGWLAIVEAPGTHLPLKRGSWLNLVKCNLTKLTTTSLAVKRSTSLAVKRFRSLAVKRFTSVAVKRFTSLAVKRSTS